MRRAVLCVLTLLLVCVLTCAAQAAERRVALVIGNSVYEHADPLANPVLDAQAIASKLREIGFAEIQVKANEYAWAVRARRGA